MLTCPAKIGHICLQRTSAKPAGDLRCWSCWNYIQSDLQSLFTWCSELDEEAPIDAEFVEQYQFRFSLTSE